MMQLEYLAISVGKGHDAVEYIQKIDKWLYAHHAFPLPCMGKVSINPTKQANSGLLPIHEFPPLKIMIELWYYIQVKFKNKHNIAKAQEEFLTEPAQIRHDMNVRTYGQWEVLDDAMGRQRCK